MPIIHVNKENFESTLTSNDLVIFDFWAAWCGPCRMLGAVLEDLSIDHPELVIAKVNVDEEGELAQTFKIRSIPQLYISKNNVIVKNISGYVGADVILEAIK